jgi:hypothetical protein
MCYGYDHKQSEELMKYQQCVTNRETLRVCILFFSCDPPIVQFPIQLQQWYFPSYFHCLTIFDTFEILIPEISLLWECHTNCSHR